MMIEDECKPPADLSEMAARQGRYNMGVESVHAASSPAVAGNSMYLTHAQQSSATTAMSFTNDELYEVNDALREVVTRMCEQGQTEIEIRERSLGHLWSASKKVTVLLLGDADTPGIKNHEPVVLHAIASPKKLKTS